ncbi:hypothetical protein D3C72_2176090 [compost metagenome]
MKEMPTKTCAYRALRWTSMKALVWKPYAEQVLPKRSISTTVPKRANCASLILPALFIMMNMKGLMLSQKTARK